MSTSALAQQIRSDLGSDLLNPQEASLFLRVSTGTLANWRFAGYGPTFVKVGRLVQYHRADLVAWLEGQRRQGTYNPAATANNTK